MLNRVNDSKANAVFIWQHFDIPSALPYTSLKFTCFLLSIVSMGIAWNLGPLPPEG